jgi:Lon protease-like protein
MTDSDSLVDFSGVARLFPLPNLVLFPHVVQGLHIFEPRYRELMADALADDRLMALVLLRPGWEEEYEREPAIESVACLGRVSWHEKLPDGRYNLRLQGLSRVKIIQELPTNHLYRTAHVELLPDRTLGSPAESSTLRKSLAAEVLPRFEPEGQAHKQLRELFDGEMSLGQLCDVLAYALPLPMEIKQALLMEAIAEHRIATMVDALRASAARADRRFPPDFSSN